MDTEQVSRYVMSFLEATNCHILEKTPVYVTVKLSEQADRALTNRPYYWGFIDRTGAEAETMRFTFVFNPALMPEERAPVSYVTQPATAPTLSTDPDQANQEIDAALGPDSALQRYFGVAPAFTGGGGGIGRIPKENVNFGSRRLDQLMFAAREHGQFICLFDQQGNLEGQDMKRQSKHSTAYEPWLLVNLKLEFACDLKREEIHSYGVSFVSGQVLNQFMERLNQRVLSPKLPSHVHTMTWRHTLDQAIALAEQTVRIQIKPYDMDWAIDASERLEEELDSLASYYEPLLQKKELDSTSEREQSRVVESTAEDKPITALTSEDMTSTEQPSSMSIEEQYAMRQAELRWQFEPRIHAQLINTAIVYLPFGDPELNG